MSSFHHPFEFGCLAIRNFHVTAGRQDLNTCLFEVMRTGNAEIFIPPLALLILGGAADDGITQVFYKHQRYALLPPLEFPGLERSATIFGRPGLLDNPQALKPLLRGKLARKRFWNDDLSSRIVTPGPSFIRMLKALRGVMAILSREPILVDTGQYRPKYQVRTYQDMENQVANELSSLENYQAKVRILTKEYLIKTHLAPKGLTGRELAARLTRVKAQMRFLGYVRDYREVEKEIKRRHNALRGVNGGDRLPPRRRRDQRGDGGDPPPTHG